jgi:hypothetical protein
VTLAVTTVARSEALPEISVVGDFVPGYEASGIGGMGVPKNTPVEVIERLNKGVNAALAEPQMKARLPSRAAGLQPRAFFHESGKYAERRKLRFAGLSAWSWGFQGGRLDRQ